MPGNAHEYTRWSESTRLSRSRVRKLLARSIIEHSEASSQVVTIYYFSLRTIKIKTILLQQYALFYTSSSASGLIYCVLLYRLGTERGEAPTRI